MIFESQLGICPSEWLKFAPLDDFLAENRIPILSVEDAMVSISGLHITLLRLILASFFSIGAGILHRFVPTANGTTSYSVLHPQLRREIEPHIQAFAGPALKHSHTREFTQARLIFMPECGCALYCSQA